MNYFLKRRWWAVAITVLVIANTGTIIFFWATKTKLETPPPPKGMPGGPPSLLINELDLSNEQQQQYTQLFHQHRQQIRAVNDSLRLSKERLFELLGANKPAEEEIQKRASEAAAIQIRIDVLTFRHMLQVKEICDPQQQKQFDKVINKVLQRLAPPPPPPAPPAPGHEPETLAPPAVENEKTD